MAESPTACKPGAAPDMNALFRDLRQRWLDAKPGRIGTHLCQRLETRKQLVTSWATGSDKKRAPWWAIMSLCDDLRLELRLTPDGVVLTRRRGRGEGGPSTRADDVVVPWLANPFNR